MLDADYDEYIRTISAVIFHRGSSLVQDLLLNITEELGEAAKAFSIYTGTNPRKPQAGTVHDVTDELADVVCSSLVAIALLGVDPQEALRRQVAKVKSRFPEVWEPRP